MENENCKCTHHKLIPLCIISIGAVFLLGEINVFTPEAVGMLWPLLLIVIGIAKLKRRKCC